jgi:hypothetical protein
LTSWIFMLMTGSGNGVGSSDMVISCSQYGSRAEDQVQSRRRKPVKEAVSRRASPAARCSSNQWSARVKSQRLVSLLKGRRKRTRKLLAPEAQHLVLRQPQERVSQEAGQDGEAKRDEDSESMCRVCIRE